MSNAPRENSTRELRHRSGRRRSPSAPAMPQHATGPRGHHQQRPRQVFRLRDSPDSPSRRPHRRGKEPRADRGPSGRRHSKLRSEHRHESDVSPHTAARPRWLLTTLPFSPAPHRGSTTAGTRDLEHAQPSTTAATLSTRPRRVAQPSIRITKKKARPTKGPGAVHSANAPKLARLQMSSDPAGNL